MKKIGNIYKIVNPKGAIYIGQTTRLNARMEVYRNKRCKSQQKLYNSLNKYGWDNHIVEILYTGDTNKHLLNALEIYYIEYYQSYLTKNGLNLTPGRNGGGKTGNRKGIKHTKEAIEKNRASHLGKKATKTTKEKMSKSQKGKSRMVNPLIKEDLRKRQSETTTRIRNSEEYNNKYNKSILQYDLNNIFIKETNCYYLKKENFSIPAIRRCCRGLSKTSQGYIWKYKST